MKWYCFHDWSKWHPQGFAQTDLDHYRVCLKCGFVRKTKFSQSCTRPDVAQKLWDQYHQEKDEIDLDKVKHA